MGDAMKDEAKASVIYAVKAIDLCQRKRTHSLL